MTILAKKTKIPIKTQKNNNLLKSKRRMNIKMSFKGGPVIFTFGFARGWLAPLSPVSYATGY